MSLGLSLIDQEGKQISAIEAAQIVGALPVNFILVLRGRFKISLGAACAWCNILRDHGYYFSPTAFLSEKQVSEINQFLKLMGYPPVIKEKIIDR